MTNYTFVERGYPITDSAGDLCELFLGSREGAEEYVKMLEVISNRNAVVPETYHIGKSIAVYCEAKKFTNGDE